VAGGKTIRSFQFYALGNFGPIYSGLFNFKVLLVSGELNALGARTVLFESAPVSVPFVAYGGRYTMIDVDMSCAKLREGEHYTLIIDALETRDGVLDVGQILTTTPGESGYADGEFYTLNATGQGRAADLSAAWNATGYDIAFHMAFFNESTPPVPSLVDATQIQSVSGTCRIR